ncbi:hypothetical protein SANTM175S_08017 [Streptomyces antimycoticus]
MQSFSAREMGHFGAPSLITRTTNDVQQVQMLCLMAFTLMVSAPIMCVGGVVMALNQDVPLSGLLLLIVPTLGVVVTFIVRRMRPLFRHVQERIDTVNRVLREQITGIRVIRAFVRDTHERDRFTAANTGLMDVSLRAGRLMSLMFPTVMLVVNVSSVAVVWFGGHRIDSGGMQIGALTAFLSYLAQILSSVMMATFMFMMVPRAEVCAERVQEVLGTQTSVVPPLVPVAAAPADAGGGLLELRNVEVRLPRRRRTRAARHLADRPARPDHRRHRLHRQRQVHPARAGAAAVRRDRRQRPHRRGGCARPRPGGDDPDHRARPAEAVSLRRNRRLKPAVRQSRCHRRGAVAGPGDRPGTGVRGVHGGRARRPDRPGRDQCLRRAAAAAGDCPGPGPQAVRLSLSTTPSPRSTTPPTPG